jgi:S1-C subfamily serine protease
MRYLSSILATLIMLSCANTQDENAKPVIPPAQATAESTEAPPVPAKVAPVGILESAVKIHIPMPGGPGSATGTILSSTTEGHYILTNKHVVFHETSFPNGVFINYEVSVVMPDGKLEPAKVVNYSERDDKDFHLTTSHALDASLLFVAYNGTLYSHVNLADKSIVDGQHIWIVPVSPDDSAHIVEGKVINGHGEPYAGECVDAEIKFGNSGSGIYDDDGDLIGLVWGKRDSVPLHDYAATLPFLSIDIKDIGIFNRIGRVQEWLTSIGHGDLITYRQ